MVDPITAASAGGALSKAVEAAAESGGKETGKVTSTLMLKAFGRAADEIGEALARWTSYRVGNVKRIAAVADRKSIANGNDGIVNPRVARSLLEEGSYCDDELMGEYLGGLLSGGQSTDGRDDRAVSWTSLVASMSAIQLRLHFILYREWAYAIHGMEDETITGGQNVAMIYVDADQVIAALREDHPGIGSMSVALHALAGLARLDLIGNSIWNVGGVALIRQKHPVPELPFKAAIEAVPSHAGMELYGWACGLPGYSFREFMALPQVVEFDAQVPRPTAVFPYLKPGEAQADLAPPIGADGRSP